MEAIKVVKNNIKEEIKENIYLSNDPIEGIQKVILNLADIVDREEVVKGVTVSLLALESSQTNEILREACMDTFLEWESLYYKRLLELGISENDSKKISRIIQIMIEGADVSY